MKTNKSFQSADGIIGQTYETATGVKFIVIDAEPYPAIKISERYKKILDLDSGQLVAVNYRGTLIPNITVQGGVARLTKVDVEGEIINRPGAISKALGIKDGMSPCEIN